MSQNVKFGKIRTTQRMRDWECAGYGHLIKDFQKGARWRPLGEYPRGVWMMRSN
jgi:hypothetical protein